MTEGALLRLPPVPISLDHSRRSSPLDIPIPSSSRVVLFPPSPLHRPNLICKAAAAAFSASAISWNGIEGYEAFDGDGERPSSVELEAIAGEEEFDRIMEEGQRTGQLVVVLWMAEWCRKCIYLKPKLEKLAANFYPRTRFYSIDVNAVPQWLVSRAGVTKMPTIQLWKDSKKQGEVIGGHRAWLVVNEVEQMIENQD